MLREEAVSSARNSVLKAQKVCLRGISFLPGVCPPTICPSRFTRTLSRVINDRIVASILIVPVCASFIPSKASRQVARYCVDAKEGEVLALRTSIVLAT